MQAIPYIAMVSAVAALVLAAFFYRDVKSASPGNDLMVSIMKQIQAGARAFLRQEYTWVAGFVVVMAILIPVITGVTLSFLSYLLGAVLSAGAGYAGMTVATMANARTTNAAIEGPAKALPLAFRGGAVMGFCVAGLSLLGLTLSYLLFVEWIGTDDAFEIFTAFGLGAPVPSPCSPGLAEASTPRPPTWAAIWWARSRPGSQRTTPATRPRSPTPWATTSAMSPGWVQTSSRATRARLSRRLP